MEEGVVEDFVDGRSFSWIEYQNASYEIFGFFGDGDAFGKGVLDCFDSLVGLLNFRCFKRRLTDNHRIENNSKGPDIDFKRMPLFLLQNLGRDIVRSTANCSSLLVLEIKFGCQTKIPSLDLHLIIQEQIAQLQIPVDHPVLMHVFYGLQDLLTIALYLKLCQFLPSLELRI